MIRLLIVEDDQSLSYIEKTSLEEVIGGYEVTIARNGKEGLEAWRKLRPDVIVADVDMPVMNGFDMVERIRQEDKDVIVLFTSALTSASDVKAGYRLGVNNYVKKPFDPDELDAHIQALLRMRGDTEPTQQDNMFEIGIFTLNTRQSTLTNRQTQDTRTLTVREAQLLELLAANMGEVVRRDSILKEYWSGGYDYFASRSLDVFVNKLRKLLAADPSVNIKTVRGVGLMLTCG